MVFSRQGSLTKSAAATTATAATTTAAMGAAKTTTTTTTTTSSTTSADHPLGPISGRLNRRSQKDVRLNNNNNNNNSINNNNFLSVKGLPDFVRIVEVGPRDGLQNEPCIIPRETKVEFVNRLSETGLTSIEVTSFVSPRWVPQMADSTELFNQIERSENISYSALVPNEKGMRAALACGVKDIAVFASASETFSHKNINCSIEESLKRFKPVLELAKANDVRVRAYVSCVIACPYEGATDPQVVAELAQRLHRMGCHEISLGDTIGVGTPGSFCELLRAVLKLVPANCVAVHCHDTYGQALANILAAIQMGITIVDSSVAGLGGCPYAKGASGNVATEDVVYMLHGMGIQTNVDIDKLLKAGSFICRHLKSPSNSKVARAVGAP